MGWIFSCTGTSVILFAVNLSFFPANLVFFLEVCFVLLVLGFCENHVLYLKMEMICGGD